MRQFGIYSTVLVDLEAGTPAGTMPYTAAELPDVQYVQSPYTEVTDGVPTGSGKELVFTHPNHPPQWLRFDGGQYI